MAPIDDPSSLLLQGAGAGLFAGQGAASVPFVDFSGQVLEAAAWPAWQATHGGNDTITVRYDAAPIAGQLGGIMGDPHSTYAGLVASFIDGLDYRVTTPLPAQTPAFQSPGDLAALKLFNWAVVGGHMGPGIFSTHAGGAATAAWGVADFYAPQYVAWSQSGARPGDAVAAWNRLNPAPGDQLTAQGEFAYPNVPAVVTPTVRNGGGVVRNGGGGWTLSQAAGSLPGGYLHDLFTPTPMLAAGGGVLTLGLPGALPAGGGDTSVAPAPLGGALASLTSSPFLLLGLAVAAYLLLSRKS